MQIPAKIQHGEKVIATVFDKINGIIDYLNASRIRKGPGILVDESPSGTVIKLADNRPATPPQVLPASGGGVSSGLFPVYSITENHMAITPGVFYSANQDFWLMGILKIVDSTVFQVRIRDSTDTLYTSVPVSGNDYIPGETLIHYVCVPIPANRKFYLTGTSANAWQCILEPFGTNGNDVILTTYNS